MQHQDRRRTQRFGRAAFVIQASLFAGTSLAATPTVAVGENHSLTLRSDGTVASWGLNRYGALANGTSGNSSGTPQPISGLSNVSAICAGSDFSLFLLADGTIKGSGDNQHGQLGNGNATNQTTPATAQISGVSQIGCGQSFSVALKSDGTVWSWGYGAALGEVNGIYNLPSRSTPAQVPGLSGVTRIAAGSSGTVLALKSDGTLWGWGTAAFSANVPYVPTQISSAPSNISALQVGNGHVLLLTTDGAVWTFGSDNSSGQISRSSNLGTPTKLTTPTSVSKIGVGWYSSFAITSSGALYGWGKNTSGQLGDFGFTNQSTPAIVTTAPTNLTAIAGGNAHTIAYKADNTIWGKGDNTSGQLGNGTVGGSSNKLPVASFTSALIPTSGVLPATGGGVNVILRDTSTDSDGTIAAWLWKVTNSQTNQVVCSYTSKDVNDCFVTTTGTYYLDLTVTDDRTGQATATRQNVTILPMANQSPQADFTITAEGDNVVYVNAAASRDPDGSIVQYQWSISPSDGVTMDGTGRAITERFRFATSGTRNITLVVTDDKGATGSRTSATTATLLNPIARFTATATGLVVKVDGSSSQATSANIVSYRWSASNGATAVCDSSTSDCKLASFTFTQAGTITLTLTAVDSRGVSGTATQTVTVSANVPPTAQFTWKQTTTTAPYTITLDGSGSKANTSSSTLSSFAWSTDQGQTATGSTASLSFSNSGTYIVTLTVTDSLQQSTKSVQSITVAGPSMVSAPVIAISPAATVPADTVVTLTFPAIANATSYRLYYASQSGQYQPGKYVAITSGQQFPIPAGTDLYLVVKAVGSSGESTASNELHVVAQNTVAATSVISVSPTQTVSEKAGQVTLTFTRSGDSSQAAYLRYRTVDGSAIAGLHYTSRIGKLTWAAGDTRTQQLTIPVIDNAQKNSDRTFSVALTSSANATVSNNAVAITIQDDDATASTQCDLSFDAGSGVLTIPFGILERGTLDDVYFTGKLQYLPENGHHYLKVLDFQSLSDVAYALGDCYPAQVQKNYIVAPFSSGWVVLKTIAPRNGGGVWMEAVSIRSLNGFQ